MSSSLTFSIIRDNIRDYMPFDTFLAYIKAK